MSAKIVFIVNTIVLGLETKQVITISIIISMITDIN